MNNASHPLQTYLHFAPRLGNAVYIADSARVIGDVTLGDDCSVWPMAVIRGDVHTITIGTRTNIQDNVVLHCTHRSQYHPDGFGLTIGDDVTVGHSAILHGCTIGNNVLVGMNATVLDGATVADNVMIAAGALVPPGTTLESGYLYVGAPVKQVRRLSDEQIEYMHYGAQNYVKLKNDYLV